MTELAVLACLAFDLRASSEELAKFKLRLSRCSCVDSIMDVSGTYDLIVQCHFASLAHYNEQIDSIRPQIASLARRLDVNFICKLIERREDESVNSIWLPCEGGRKRVETGMIDKVVAEGDYMRIYVGNWNCLMHETMAKLSQHLRPPHFIKLRRSCLVRTNFIERLTHEGRRWTARLIDGSYVQVAQSNAAAVVRLIAGESSTSVRTSSTFATLADQEAAHNEMRVKQQV